MRADDYFEELTVSPSYDWSLGAPRNFRRGWITQLRTGPLPTAPDVEAGVALARLVHDDLERFGTSGGKELSEDDMRISMLALRELTRRLNLPFEPPFRDYGTFRSFWVRNDGYGSWQARRDMLNQLFDPLHDALADLETAALRSTLSTAVSPRGRTGWDRVDAEIAELRRHFQLAQTPQDYRNVGNDCVIVTEAISRTSYDLRRHLREGEDEPRISDTKNRLERVVDDAAPGPDNVRLRRLARLVIEMAQEVKHRSTPNRREAGIAADSVILLANILRRLDEENLR